MFNTMHLFAGAGGGLLADLILGHNPIVAVEWDAYACAVLRERAADGWFPGLHVHEGDVRVFDPSPWTGRVDCIHAGFPCQDISAAGKGAGIRDGARSGLWREVVRVAGVVRPRFIMLENSPRITNRGIDVVLGDLATLGYDARWCVLGAADVGAPHQRHRWWCLANANKDRRERTGIPDQFGIRPQVLQSDLGRGRQNLSDAMRDGLEDALSRRCAAGAACAAGETTPGRHQRPGWYEAEPAMGRVADGVAHHVDQIACLGNGQVPLCAATAWCLLGGPVNHEAPPNPTDHGAGAQEPSNGK